jgi:hypothetical protein
VREKANLEKPSGVDLSVDAHCRHQFAMEESISLRCVKNTCCFDRINALVERRNLPPRMGSPCPPRNPDLACTLPQKSVEVVRVGTPSDRTALLGVHPEEAEEPRGRRRREWNGGTRIGMHHRR